MILLMLPKYFDMIKDQRSTTIFAEAGILDGVRVFVDQNLPETDKHGNPIFAWKVDGGIIWHWTGEPIKLPENLK